MKEHIYAFEINDGFNKKDGSCPFCGIFAKLEDTELDLILGASMMEPEIRQITNKKGFCPTHYRKMFPRKNRLGMALTMESHLDELKKEIRPGGLLAKDPAAKSVARIEELEKTCYVCDRLSEKFGRVLSNAADMYAEESEFRKKFREQTFFCLPHYRQFLQTAVKCLNRKEYAQLAEDAVKIESAALDKLKNDISWFCKKFDFNYENEPWYDSKDAVERTIRFLSGNIELNTK